MELTARPPAADVEPEDVGGLLSGNGEAAAGNACTSSDPAVGIEEVVGQAIRLVVEEGFKCGN
ncbi:MAG: hypothetical protein M5U19_14790 [Microthrixaceae bacterium]|nr:hypothetical protein [Microthrixaceae bacterium]